MVVTPAATSASDETIQPSGPFKVYIYVYGLVVVGLYDEIRKYDDKWEETPLKSQLKMRAPSGEGKEETRVHLTNGATRLVSCERGSHVHYNMVGESGGGRSGEDVLATQTNTGPSGKVKRRSTLRRMDGNERREWKSSTWLRVDKEAKKEE